MKRQIACQAWKVASQMIQRIAKPVREENRVPCGTRRVFRILLCLSVLVVIVFKPQIASATDKESLLELLRHVDTKRESSIDGWSISFTDEEREFLREDEDIDISDFYIAVEQEKIRHDNLFYWTETYREGPSLRSVKKFIFDDQGHEMRGRFFGPERVPWTLEHRTGLRTSLALGISDYVRIVIQNSITERVDAGLYSLDLSSLPMHFMYSACFDHADVSSDELESSFEVSSEPPPKDEPDIKRFLCVGKRANGDTIRLQLDFDMAKDGMPVRSEKTVWSENQSTGSGGSTVVRAFEDTKQVNGLWIGTRYSLHHSGTIDGVDDVPISLLS